MNPEWYVFTDTACGMSGSFSDASKYVEGMVGHGAKRFVLVYCEDGKVPDVTKPWPGPAMVENAG